ncbi:hypothetical protein [Rossellomorea sp. BNER]|uniref:hypothetical protein n=1 Tax=Rossellomorea sp. BNER TaxID=2962031 RepID=UPI003AF2735D|nr:hypothetical protein [Rossellomorea sp. BNER]
MDKQSVRIGATPPPKPSKQVNRIEIYLKTGHTIKVTCEKYGFTTNTFTGEYTGYEFKGLVEPKSLGINPNQIAGYILN